MMERIAEASPRFKARVAGVFEMLEGMTSHERLFWLGFVSSLIGVACHIAWILLFYYLFKPVNRSLSLLAAFVGLVVCAMQALTCLLYVAPLLVLQGGSSVSAFTTDQLQALAYVFFRLNGYAFDIDLVFFGLWCVLAGYLIFKSTFLPRILGVLLAIDGLGWMTFVVPPFALHLFPFIAAASALAEIPVQLWLVVMGVNPERWKEQAAAEVRT